MSCTTQSGGRSIQSDDIGVELKGVRSGVERRRGVSGLKAGGGRRETTAKVLKKRRSPRERGRMGTSVRDAPGSSISGITGTGGRDAGSDFNALTGSTNSIPCATAVGYGVTHDRGDASAVSIAFPVAGSCGMDVHFPEAPSNCLLYTSPSPRDRG